MRLRLYQEPGEAGRSNKATKQQARVHRATSKQQHAALQAQAAAESQLEMAEKVMSPAGETEVAGLDQGQMPSADASVAPLATLLPPNPSADLFGLQLIQRLSETGRRGAHALNSLWKRATGTVGR